MKMNREEEILDQGLKKIILEEEVGSLNSNKLPIILALMEIQILIEMVL